MLSLILNLAFVVVILLKLSLVYCLLEYYISLSGFYGYILKCDRPCCLSVCNLVLRFGGYLFDNISFFHLIKSSAYYICCILCKTGVWNVVDYCYCFCFVNCNCCRCICSTDCNSIVSVLYLYLSRNHSGCEFRLFGYIFRPNYHCLWLGIRFFMCKNLGSFIGSCRYNLLCLFEYYILFISLQYAFWEIKCNLPWAFAWSISFLRSFCFSNLCCSVFHQSSGNFVLCSSNKSFIVDRINQAGFCCCISSWKVSCWWLCCSFYCGLDRTFCRFFFRNTIGKRLIQCNCITLCLSNFCPYNTLHCSTTIWTTVISIKMKVY